MIGLSTINSKSRARGRKGKRRCVIKRCCGERGPAIQRPRRESADHRDWAQRAVCQRTFNVYIIRHCVQISRHSLQRAMHFHNCLKRQVMPTSELRPRKRWVRCYKNRSCAAGDFKKSKGQGYSARRFANA